MKSILIVQSPLDPHPARKVLIPGKLVIGTNGDCDIVIKDEEVAPTHAALLVSESHVWVADLGSGCGTFLNGEPLTYVAEFLANGLVQIGRSSLQLLRYPIISETNVASEAQEIGCLQSDAHVRFPRQPFANPLFEIPPELAAPERYVVGKRLARGGMGIVFEAHEVASRRKVAIKMMLHEGDAIARARFVEEAQITAQLEHPSIVPLHELSVDNGGHLFYTMKMVKGVTLKDVLAGLREGKVKMKADYPLSVLLVIFQKICDAVAFAHSRRVIHRDLKPANIMIGEFGEVLVMDWGLAKIQDPLRGERLYIQAMRHRRPEVAVTLDGAIQGTPTYMSPEQARGDTKLIDHRSDIYALGAILYEILTLSPVTTGNSVPEILAKVRSGQIISPEKQTPPKGGWFHLPGFQIPSALVSIVKQCLDTEPRKRYLNVANLQEDVGAFQTGRATSHERKRISSRIRLFVRRYRNELSLIAVPFLFTSALISLPLVRDKHDDDVAARKSKAVNVFAERTHARAGQAIAEVRTLRRVLAQKESSAERTEAVQKLSTQIQKNLENLYRETDPWAVYETIEK